MNALVFGCDDAVADWVAEQPFGSKFYHPFTAIGVVNDGHLTGGFVFTSYTSTGPSIELSLAGRGVLHPRVWNGVLHYVFNQLGCVRLQCHTSASNRMVRRCLPHLGFKFEGTARRLFGKDDGYCFSLTVDDLPGFRKRWRLQ